MFPSRAVRRCLVAAILWSLVAGLLLAARAQRQRTKGKKYALLVGVTAYNHASLPDLKHTENDAQELAEVLGKSSFEEIVLLTTKDGEKRPSARPTAANIRAQLHRLLHKVNKHDTMLVALSGHGLEFRVHVDGKKKNESFFCPADAKPLKTTDAKELSKTMLGFTELYRELDASEVGVKLLLVDACRNEPVGLRGIDEEAEPRPSKGTAALFSCKSGERSFEKAELKHGIFFHFVLKGLRGDAKNKDGEVTWGQLAEYVTRQVSRESPKLISGGGRQTPHAISNLEGDSPVLRSVKGEGARTKEEPKRAEVVKGGPKDIEKSIGMTLVRIPAGKFKMGSPANEKERSTDEEQHEVAITKDFWLGIHEVTQKQFKAVMGYNPSYFSTDGEGKSGLVYRYGKPAGGKDKVPADTSDFPVENVSWAEAKLFCQKLTALSSGTKNERKYRLPTEAEWEYACRGGAASYQVFHFGNSLFPTQANFDGSSPYGRADKGAPLERTCKVGTYKKDGKNGFGLYDMHGNVWEWCADWYGSDYYGKSPPRDPPGPSKGSDRVLRGGSWHSNGQGCRSAIRSRALPASRARDLGFRVALDT